MDGNDQSNPWTEREGGAHRRIWFWRTLSRGATVGFLILLLATVVVGVKLWLGQNWVLSASAPREGADLKSVLATPPVAALREDQIGIEGLRQGTNQTHFWVSIPDSGGKKPDLGGFRLIRARPGQAFEVVPGQSLRLGRLGVAYGPLPPDQVNSWSHRFPLRYFESDPAGEWVESVFGSAESKWQSQESFDGQWPTYKFLMDYPEGLDVKLLSADMYDAVTRAKISSGHAIGVGGRPPQMRITMRPEIWRPTPVLLVVDLALGPVETMEMEPTPGTRFRIPGGALELLAVFPRAGTGSSMSSNGQTNTFKLRRDTPEKENEEPGSSWVFHGYPNGMRLPLDVDFLDAAGKTLSGRGGMASSHFKNMDLKEPLEEVKRIRVRHYPHRIRLVMEFNELPGLPDDNREVSNLFDQRIPYARFRRVNDIRRYLEDILQVSIQGNSPQTTGAGAKAIPPGPYVFTNATPRELMRAYLDFYREPRGVEVQAEKSTVRIRGPWPEDLTKHLPAWIRRLF